jgi:hypothetical protein
LERATKSLVTAMLRRLLLMTKLKIRVFEMSMVMQICNTP